MRTLSPPSTKEYAKGRLRARNIRTIKKYLIAQVTIKLFLPQIARAIFVPPRLTYCTLDPITSTVRITEFFLAPRTDSIFLIGDDVGSPQRHFFLLCDLLFSAIHSQFSFNTARLTLGDILL